jgi:hypothetical protein
VQGGTPPGMVREALGCVRRGGLSSPAYNHSVGYTCPQGRLLAQNTSHAAKGIVFEQVLLKLHFTVQNFFPAFRFVKHLLFSTDNLNLHYFHIGHENKNIFLRIKCTDIEILNQKLKFASLVRRNYLYLTVLQFFKVWHA